MIDIIVEIEPGVRIGLIYPRADGCGFGWEPLN
jgi:hypothetical protein